MAVANNLILQVITNACIIKKHNSPEVPLTDLVDEYTKLSPEEKKLVISNVYITYNNKYPNDEPLVPEE